MTQTSSKTSPRIDAEQAVQRAPSCSERLSHLVAERLPEWLCCLVIGLMALAFNLYRLGSPSLWFDEVLSVQRARQPLPVLWQIIFSTQQNMALYYLFLHFWLSFVTRLGLRATEFVVRFPSAVFAALASMMVFLLARRFMGILGSLVAAALFVLNTLQLVYAQETRSYSMQLLLICIAWYALFAACGVGSAPIDGPAARRKWWWAGYSCAMILAIYTHLFSVLVLLAQILSVASILILRRGLLRGGWQAWLKETQPQLAGFMISLVSIGVLTIPMLLAVRHGSKTGWLPIPHPVDIYYLFLAIGGDSNAYLFTLVACCLVGLGAVILSFRRGVIHRTPDGAMQSPGGRDSSRPYEGNGALLKDGRGDWVLAVVMVCWVIVPVVVSYSVSHGSIRLFSARYLVVIVPPVLMLVGLGIVMLRWRIVQLVVVACLLLIALHHVPEYYQNAQVENWRPAALWLEQHYQPGDGMVCYNNAQGCQVCIEYYLYAYPSTAHFSADAPGSFPWVEYDITNHLGNFQAALDPAVLTAYASKHPRFFFIAGRFASSADKARALATQRWLDTHYHLLAQTSTATVSIRLYTT